MAVRFSNYDDDTPSTARYEALLPDSTATAPSLSLNSLEAPLFGRKERRESSAFLPNEEGSLYTETTDSDCLERYDVGQMLHVKRE